MVSWADERVRSRVAVGECEQSLSYVPKRDVLQSCAIWLRLIGCKNVCVVQGTAGDQTTGYPS